MAGKKSPIYAFIDSQNVNLAIRDLGWRLDFRKFRIYLKEKYHVSKAFLFIGYIPGNQSLYTFLQQSGYVLIFKPTMVLPNRKVKGNVDAELVLHTMIEYKNYDQAVIVTGDGDFACLIEYLASKGKLSRLLIPNAKQYSRLLRKPAAGKIDFLNTLEKRVKLVQKKKGEVIT